MTDKEKKPEAAAQTAADATPPAAAPADPAPSASEAPAQPAEASQPAPAPQPPAPAAHPAPAPTQAYAYAQGAGAPPPPIANITIPNLLTGVRCIAVFLLAILLLWPFGGPYLTGALLVFAFAAATDWLDGTLARLWNIQTDFGRMLDQIADKLLVSVCLLCLCTIGLIDGLNAFAAAIIVGREIIISGLREYMSGRGIVVHSSLAGKWKATFQMVAIAALLAAPLAPFEIVARISGLLILWLAMVLSVASAIQYVMDTKDEWAK